MNQQMSYFATFEAVFDFVLSKEVLDWFSESLFCRSVSFSFNSLFFFSSCFTVDDTSLSLSPRLSQLVQPSYKIVVDSLQFQSIQSATVSTSINLCITVGRENKYACEWVRNLELFIMLPIRTLTNTWTENGAWCTNWW